MGFTDNIKKLFKGKNNKGATNEKASNPNNNEENDIAKYQKMIDDTYQEAAEIDKKLEALNNVRSDFRERIKTTQTAPGTVRRNNMARESAADLLKRAQQLEREEQQKKRETYIQNNNYAQILNQLLDYLKRRENLQRSGIETKPKYYGDTKESVLAQYNYDNFDDSIPVVPKKESMFIPFFYEIERLGGSLGENVPTDIKEFYNEYKETDEDNKQVLMGSGLNILQFLGIINLKETNEFSEWPLKECPKDQLLLSVNMTEYFTSIFGKPMPISELPEEYKNCVKDTSKEDNSR